jgi:PAS domain S-box-containing protein
MQAVSVQKDRGRPNDLGELRRRAEAAWRERGSDADKLSADNVSALVHELEVHQIQLEMQNEELRRAQEELEAARDKYADLYDFAPAGHLTINENGQIVEANLTAATLLGTERGVLLGQSLSRFILPDDQGVYYKHRRAVLAAKERQTCDVRMVTRRGTQFDSQMQSVGIPDNAGTVTKWRTVISDVTEQKQAQQALQKSESKVRALLNSTGQAIYGVDLSGKCTFANPAFLRMLGYQHQDELLGKNIHALIHHTDANGQPYPEEKCRVCEAFRRGEGMHVDDEVLWRADNTSFPAEYWSQPMHENGQLVGAVVAFIDITERKQTDQALRVRNRAMAGAANGVMITDPNRPDNPLIYCNPAFEKITGYTLDEVLGRNARFLQDDDRAQEGLKEVRAAIQAGHECHVVVRNYRKDGTRFWNELTIAPVRDTNGQIVHFVGIQNDITERKQAEEALRRERDFAESLIETAQTIVLVLSPEGRIVRFNPFMEQLSGYRLGEVQGEDWFAIFLPKSEHSRMKKIFSEAMSGIQTRGNISPIIARDGQTRDISWSDKVLRDADGKRAGLLSIGHDITDSRRRDAALRDREQQLGLILASTAEGIFGMDLEGRFTFGNRSCVELLGYEDEKDLLGQDMHTLIHHTRSDGTPHPKEECLIYQARYQNKTVDLDDEVLWRADGSSFPAEGRSYPMLRDGQVVGTVVSFMDITERKEKEAQLLQAQKMQVVGQLTGGIAHDFNNLLTVILANLGLLAEEIASVPGAGPRDLINDAFSAARDGAALTHRLLAFSRKQPLQVKRIDIDDILRNIRRFLRRTLRESIALRISCAKEALPVLVDPGQLESALLNLVVNARDAMPEGGTLIIETTHEFIGPDEPTADPELAPGHYVMITVKDSGIGMSPEDAARAIEPFFTTKPHGKGSGLGLSMVYGFARQSGGGLLLRSALGKGTSVSILLPEDAQAIEEDDAELASRNAPRGSETILLVEDESQVRRAAKRILLGLGYQVIEAENAAAARKVFEEKAAMDLLFSDIVMPGDMNGRELARWALPMRPGLKVLLTTGFQEEETAQRSVANGGFHLLKKPYIKEELARAVRAALDAQAVCSPAQ